jgi:hypothetical protein
MQPCRKLTTDTPQTAHSQLRGLAPQLRPPGFPNHVAQNQVRPPELFLVILQLPLSRNSYNTLLAVQSAVA